MIGHREHHLDKSLAKNLAKLKKLTAAQKAELEEIEAKAIARFEGSLDELESALGMLRMGHHVGWKVLYLIHSKQTIRKYEEMLDIKIREVFEEAGPSSERSIGYQLAKKVSNFWKIISGEEKIENRRQLER